MTVTAMQAVSTYLDLSTVPVKVDLMVTAANVQVKIIVIYDIGKER